MIQPIKTLIAVYSQDAFTRSPFLLILELFSSKKDCKSTNRFVQIKVAFRILGWKVVCV